MIAHSQGNQIPAAKQEDCISVGCHPERHEVLTDQAAERFRPHGRAGLVDLLQAVFIEPRIFIIRIVEYIQRPVVRSSEALDNLSVIGRELLSVFTVQIGGKQSAALHALRFEVQPPIHLRKAADPVDVFSLRRLDLCGSQALNHILLRLLDNANRRRTFL